MGRRMAKRLAKNRSGTRRNTSSRKANLPVGWGLKKWSTLGIKAMALTRMEKPRYRNTAMRAAERKL